MELKALWAVLEFSLLSACVWGQFLEDEFGVSISGTKVTLTCPDASEGSTIWKKNDEIINGVEESTLTLIDSETEYSGQFHCKKKEINDDGYYLYLKTRVCDGCMEVEVLTVAGIIIADVFITLGVLVLVYYWSKGRKAKAKPVGRGGGAGGRTRGANKERPPPVPNPDYEPIRKGQRDLYAGLNQRAI
ncbi:T-cell surface glycoprotein CD3 epsilon chain isoform X2 [Dromiciops gliroides]|uniref:T-cell surface glycoprotein CD3 epsilon chain isoform X2 n=1 Tax=Dromiciops gliroides TaxID=33562 RepID=UPI001CC3FEB8|nr:T-cell surface glycoprotein CD3 epsilon chain isoform X2 [Dromiciops gliroides]